MISGARSRKSPHLRCDLDRKGGVFAQGGKTLVRRIGAVRLHTEPVGQLGEEVVAGVLYAFLDVLAVMRPGQIQHLMGLEI